MGGRCNETKTEVTKVIVRSCQQVLLTSRHAKPQSITSCGSHSSTRIPIRTEEKHLQTKNPLAFAGHSESGMNRRSKQLAAANLDLHLSKQSKPLLTFKDNLVIDFARDQITDACAFFFHLHKPQNDHNSPFPSVKYILE